MTDREMFGVVVAFVLVARIPVDVEVLLLCAVLDPVEPHVNCLGSFLFDRVIGETHSGGVIDLDRCGGCWLPHIHQHLANG